MQHDTSELVAGVEMWVLDVRKVAMGAQAVMPRRESAIPADL
jgi:hypothetical protein